MRKFEKISFEQFKIDINSSRELYESYTLPKRKTRNSGGYDLCSLINYILPPGKSVVIPTGVKYISPTDEVLFIILRSSLGFKFGLKLANQVGVIDSDYYNNSDNEGHIFIKLENTSEKDFDIKIGAAVAQGVFIKYGVVDEEEEIMEIRKGGLGSTTGI